MAEGPSIHTEELALFSKLPVNVVEEKISLVEYRPSFMSSGEYSSIQFNIPGNSSQYVDEIAPLSQIPGLNLTQYNNIGNFRPNVTQHIPRPSTRAYRARNLFN